MTKYSKILLPTFYLGVVAVMVVSIFLVISGIKNYANETNNTKHILDSVFEEPIAPVIKTENNTIIKPYISEDVKIGRTFYDYKGESKNQESSLIVYENTYIQNTGVDYVSKEDFDIVSVLSGEVMSVEKSDVYGTVITIKHNDNLVSVYSNVVKANVTVGASVSQGEIIASSNKSSLVSNDESLLHFEVYYKGNALDPESLYTMSVSDLK